MNWIFFRVLLAFTLELESDFSNKTIKINYRRIITLTVFPGEALLNVSNHWST